MLSEKEEHFAQEEQFVCIQAGILRRLCLRRSITNIPFFAEFDSLIISPKDHCQFIGRCSLNHIIWPGDELFLDLILSFIRDRSLPENLSQNDIQALKKEAQILQIDSLYWELQVVYPHLQSVIVSRYAKDEWKALLALGEGQWFMGRLAAAFRSWALAWNLANRDEKQKKQLYKNKSGIAFSSYSTNEVRGLAFLHLAAIDAFSDQKHCLLRWNQALRFLPSLSQIDVHPPNPKFLDRVRLVGEIHDETSKDGDKMNIQVKLEMADAQSDEEVLNITVSARGTPIRLKIAYPCKTFEGSPLQLLLDNQAPKEDCFPFLDVDPVAFEHIAKMLRNGALSDSINSNTLNTIKQEATYLGLDSVVSECDTFYELFRSIESDHLPSQALGHILLANQLYFLDFKGVSRSHWQKAYRLISVPQLRATIQKKMKKVSMCSRDRAMMFVHLANLTAMEKGPEHAISYAQKAVQIHSCDGMTERVLIMSLANAGKYEAILPLLRTGQEEILKVDGILDFFEMLRIHFDGIDEISAYLTGSKHQQLGGDYFNAALTCTLFLNQYPQSLFMQCKLAFTLQEIRYGRDDFDDEEKSEADRRCKDAHKTLYEAIVAFPVAFEAIVTFAQILLDDDDLMIAKEMIDLGLQHFPQHPAAHQLQSKLLRAQQKPRSALFAAQKAIEICQNHFASDWIAVALAAEDAQEDDIAIDARLKALKSPCVTLTSQQNNLKRLYDLNRKEEALCAWPDILDQFPTDEGLHARLVFARCLLESNMVEEALEETDKVISIIPDSIEGLSIMLEAILAIGEVDVADILIEQREFPVELAPTSLFLAFANALINQKQSDEQSRRRASQFLEQALDRDPKCNLAWQLKAQIAYIEADYDALNESTIMAEECQASHVYTQRMRLYFLHATGKYNDFIDYYHKSAVKEERDAFDQLLFAESNFMLDRPDIAIEILKKIENPTKEVYKRLIDWLSEKEDHRFEEILEIAKRASVEFPHESDFHEGIFSSLFEMGDDEGALIAARETVKYDSSNTRRLNNLAMMLRRCDLFQESEKYAQRSILIEPSYNAYLQLARTSMRMDKDEKTSFALQSAISIDPQKSDAWEGFQSFYNQKGNLEKELHACRKILRLDSKNARIWLRTGKILQEQGKYDRAVKAFRKVLKLNDDQNKIQALLELAKSHRRGNTPLLSVFFARQAVKLQNDINSLELLADAFEHAEMLGSASEQWEMICSLDDAYWSHARTSTMYILAKDCEKATSHRLRAKELQKDLQDTYMEGWEAYLDIRENAPESESFCKAMSFLDKRMTMEEKPSHWKDQWLSGKILQGDLDDLPIGDEAVFTSSQVKDICILLRKRSNCTDLIVSFLMNWLSHREISTDIILMATGQLMLLDQWKSAEDLIDDVIKANPNQITCSDIRSISQSLFNVGNYSEAYKWSVQCPQKCAISIGEVSAALYLQDLRRCGDIKVLEGFSAIQGYLNTPDWDEIFLLGNMVKSSYLSVAADVRVRCAESCIDALADDCFDTWDFVEALRLSGRLKEAKSVAESALALSSNANDKDLHQEYCAILLEMRENENVD